MMHYDLYSGASRISLTEVSVSSYLYELCSLLYINGVWRKEYTALYGQWNYCSHELLTITILPWS